MSTFNATINIGTPNPPTPTSPVRGSSLLEFSFYGCRDSVVSGTTEQLTGCTFLTDCDNTPLPGYGNVNITDFPTGVIHITGLTYNPIGDQIKWIKVEVTDVADGNAEDNIDCQSKCQNIKISNIPTFTPTPVPTSTPTPTPTQSCSFDASIVYGIVATPTPTASPTTPPTAPPTATPTLGPTTPPTAPPTATPTLGPTTPPTAPPTATPTAPPTATPTLGPTPTPTPIITTLGNVSSGSTLSEVCEGGVGGITLYFSGVSIQIGESLYRTNTAGVLSNPVPAGYYYFPDYNTIYNVTNGSTGAVASTPACPTPTPVSTFLGYDFTTSTVIGGPLAISLVDDAGVSVCTSPEYVIGNGTSSTVAWNFTVWGTNITDATGMVLLSSGFRSELTLNAIFYVRQRISGTFYWRKFQLNGSPGDTNVTASPIGTYGEC